MKAILRQVRISPKKANLVAGMVRGKSVRDALSILQFTPKKGARIVAKVIQSAAANAQHNFSQKATDLVISSIIVNKGMAYKRSLPISRGRTHPILKFTSHITVEVSGAVKTTDATPTLSDAIPETTSKKKSTPKKSSIKSAT